MMLDSFQQRERALENEFFYRVDQQLLLRMKQELKHQREVDSLATATGIEDHALIEHLLELGIRRETLFALSLVPLIQVAWADKIVQLEEREELLKVSEELGHSPHSESFQILDSWLNQVPPASLFETWKDYIHELARHLPANQIRSLKEETLRRAKRIALAAGGPFGRGAISYLEQHVLNEIAEAFQQESKV